MHRRGPNTNHDAKAGLRGWDWLGAPSRSPGLPLSPLYVGHHLGIIWAQGRVWQLFWVIFKFFLSHYFLLEGSASVRAKGVVTRLITRHAVRNQALRVHVGRKSGNSYSRGLTPKAVAPLSSHTLSTHLSALGLPTTSPTQPHNLWVRVGCAEAAETAFPRDVLLVSENEM